MSDQEKKCEFCWHPSRHVEGRDGLHNKGCPMLNEAENMAEWKRGRDYGFEGNRIKASQYRFYSPAFILGLRIGLNEIDNLVNLAAEARFC